MRQRSRRICAAGLMGMLMSFGAPALADTLADYIGYTIAAKRTVVGWVGPPQRLSDLAVSGEKNILRTRNKAGTP